MATGRFNRLALDENLPAQARKDVNTSKPPVITLAAPYALQIAHVVNGVVTNIADWSQVRLQITSQCGKDATRYLDRIVTGLNPALTQADWDAGTGQHASFVFNGMDTSFLLYPCDNGPLYYVISVTRLDGQIVPLGNGLISVDRQHQVQLTLTPLE